MQPPCLAAEAFETLRKYKVLFCFYMFIKLFGALILRKLSESHCFYFGVQHKITTNFVSSRMVWLVFEDWNISLCSKLTSGIFP